ncbi:MAG: SBBP repeat-containing protein [Bacteroidia bacterium]|nr:SBBP repeat-containing protein [Bacteroidia bacterium]
MIRTLLVLLASTLFQITATASDPDLSAPVLPESRAFQWVETQEASYFLLALPGRQVRFLPGGTVSMAEYRRQADDTDPRFLPDDPKAHQYEVMVWNWQWSADHAEKAPTGMGNLQRSTLQQTDPAKQDLFAELWYKDIHPGIDLRYYLTAEGQLKYDFIVAPGADPSLITAEISGGDFDKIDSKGRLVVETPWGKIRDEAPVSFVQREGAWHDIASGYELSEGMLHFDIDAERASTETLIIDPLTMSWSTFLHSSTSDDYVIAITRDANNFIYAAGYTETPTFPVTPGVYQGSFQGVIDAFVSKLGPNGDYLVWSTYLGGSDWDLAYAMDIDANGRLYVGGYTASSDFPVTANAAQQGKEGFIDAFIVCMNLQGTAIHYSTYLGGSDRDYLYDLICTATGQVYVTGYTFSGDFPVTMGAYDQSYNGYGDAFVTGISANGSSLLFASYLGGTGFDMGQALAQAPDGKIGVVGNTNSLNIPLVNPLFSQLNLGGGNATDDGFFFRISEDGSTLLNGTYLGGSGSDGLYAVQVNAVGDWFMAGNTYSTDLFTTVNAYQKNYQGNGDVMVARLSANATSVNYLTYLGGTDVDYLKAIAVEPDDELYLLGATRSANWPVTGGGAPLAGQYDSYLTHLTANGAAINSSVLLGGSYNDYPRSPSGLDLTGNKLALAITTHSINVPSAGNGFQKNKLNGLADAPWLVGLEGDVVLDAVMEPDLEQALAVGNAFAVSWDGDTWAWSMEKEMEEQIRLSLWNMMGQSIWEEQGTQSSGDLRSVHAAAGTYVLRAIRADGTQFHTQILWR